MARRCFLQPPWGPQCRCCPGTGCAAVGAHGQSFLGALTSGQVCHWCPACTLGAGIHTAMPGGHRGPPGDRVMCSRTCTLAQWPGAPLYSAWPWDGEISLSPLAATHPAFQSMALARAGSPIGAAQPLARAQAQNNPGCEASRALGAENIPSLTLAFAYCSGLVHPGETWGTVLQPD